VKHITSRLSDLIGLILPTTILISMLLSCAEVADPPGGPEDKQGPFVMGSEPQNGSVDTPISDQVTIYFSETIKAPSSGKTVYISPRLDEDPEVKWKSDRLIVNFPDSFLPNQTYIVSVAAGVVDLRGNKMDSSLTVAFSTGSDIAHGALSGILYNEKGSYKAGGTIALYGEKQITDSTIFDSIYAEYLTQSATEGAFELSYLPDGDYLLLAFDDRNGDERLNPLVESYGLPDRPVSIGGKIDLSSLNMILYDCDTTTPSILSAANNTDGLIRVRFQRELKVTNLMAHPERIWLSPRTDSTVMLPALKVLDEGKDKLSSITFFAGDLSDGAYQLFVTWDTTRNPIRFEELIITAKEDKTPPELLSFEPDNIPRLPGDIEIRASFSEPIDSSSLTPGTFVLTRGAEAVPVPYVLDWSEPLSIRIVPDSLLGGEAYHLEMVEFELVDKAGNALGDTLQGFNFRTISDDSLGSISGAVVVSVPSKGNDPVLLTFRRLDGKIWFSTTAEEGAYMIDVPGGKYLASALVDTDGNGEPSKGSLKPFRFAETMATFADTIVVRPRFETAGVDFEIK